MEKGVCHICGIEGLLSFEHVPPKTAFNNIGTYLRQKIFEFGWTGADERGDGAGGYTLCRTCNNFTANRYVKAFERFVKEVAPYADKIPHGGVASLEATISPFKVFKQIAVMFCSTNGAGFSRVHPWLRRFILDPSNRDWDPRFRIFICLQQSQSVRARQGVGGVLDTRTRRHAVASEIIFWPMAYTLAIGPIPDFVRSFSLLDISDWPSRYASTYHGKVPLRIASYRRANLFLGDYRSKEEIEKESQAGRKKS